MLIPRKYIYVATLTEFFEVNAGNLTIDQIFCIELKYNFMAAKTWFRSQIIRKYFQKSSYHNNEIRNFFRAPGSKFCIL